MFHHKLRSAGFPVLLAALLLPTVTNGYTVRSDHPRLMITEEMLPELRTRCQTTHADIWNTFSSTTQNRRDDGRQAKYYLIPYSFMYLITQDAGWADWAIECVLHNCRTRTPSAPNDTWGEGVGPGEMSAVAIAYDWLYDAMTPTQRREVADTLRYAIDDQMYKNNCDDFHAWIPGDAYFSYPLSIYGDGFHDALAAEGFDGSYCRYTTRYVLGTNEIGTLGGVDGYGGKRTRTMFTMAAAFQTALGEDWANQSSFIRNGGDFWMHRLRADKRLLRVPGKWNMAMTCLPEFFAYFSSTFSNPYWAHLAKEYVEAGQGDEPYGWGWGNAWMLILWYDPNLTTSWPPPERSHYDPGSGMALMRSGWNFGPTSTDVHAAFFNGPDLVRTKSQNHFVISRGEDNLLIDSGRRFSDIDDHYYTYYVQAMAHNAVLIDDPNEPVDSYENYLGKRHDIPNPGDQVESDEALGLEKWPNAEGTYGYRGEITHYNDNGEYLYVRGDATWAYRTKASKVVREFVYLRPDIFVIRDQVVRNEDDFATKAVFHMVEKPEVSGSLQTIQGNWNTGGIFESSSLRDVYAVRGNSQCRMTFLRPNAQSGRMRIIGGGNAMGEPWKQTWEPDEPLTYSSSTGYEFWVEDRNWTPCGQYCGADDIPVRNDSPGNEAGDWRIEIESLESGEQIGFLTVLHVGPRSGEDLEYRHLETATGEAVAIVRAPGDTVVVAFSKDDGLEDVTY